MIDARLSLLGMLVLGGICCGPGVEEHWADLSHVVDADQDRSTDLGPSDVAAPDTADLSGVDTQLPCVCSPNSEHLAQDRAYLCGMSAKICAVGSNDVLGWNPVDLPAVTCVQEQSPAYFVKVPAC